jgi:hypothetical protein
MSDERALRSGEADRSTSLRAGSSPGPGPGPGVTFDSEEGAELWGLIRDYDERRLEPIEIALGRLPEVGASAHCPNGGQVVVTSAMHEVATDLRLLIGLRLAVNEDRPLPYAASLCVSRCKLVRDKRHASKVLRALVRLGVVEHVGSLPARGKGDGTKLYAPPLPAQLSPGALPGLAIGVEGRAGLVPGADQPEVELVEDPLVPVAPLSQAETVRTARERAGVHGRSLERESGE